MKDEYGIQYDSETTIVDGGISGLPDGVIGAGDSVITTGGLDLYAPAQWPTALGSNQIDTFDPDETVFGGVTFNSNNGYDDTWMLSFGFSNLTGQVLGVNAFGVPILQYGPGVIDVYYVDLVAGTFTNFMDLAIAGAIVDGVGTIMTGAVDFTNVDNLVYADLFHSGVASCGGSDSFYDIWLNCGPAGTEVSFVAHFDTGVHVTDFDYDPISGTFGIASDHDGSGTFAVPEPTTLALIGSSLLLMGGAARRKKS
jgi:hypothetical protein